MSVSMTTTNKPRINHHSFHDNHLEWLFAKAGVNAAHDAGVFIDGGGSHDHKHAMLSVLILVCSQALLKIMTFSCTNPQ